MQKNASTVTLQKSVLVSYKLLINKMLVNKESKKKHSTTPFYHHGVLENGGAVQSDQSEKTRQGR
jgi:hypothetical protein